MLAVNTVPHNHHQIDNKEITIRPIRPDDVKLEEEFFNNLSATTKYYRFMEGIRTLSPPMLIQLCDVNGKHAMAFIATVNDSGIEKQIGVSRYASGENELESELALTIADEWHHKNIDILIMEPLIKYAKNNGIKRLYTFEFAENYAMRKIAKKLGMTAKTDPDDSQLIVYSLNI
jgi:acetyltransferase